MSRVGRSDHAFTEAAGVSDVLTEVYFTW